MSIINSLATNANATVRKALVVLFLVGLAVGLSTAAMATVVISVSPSIVSLNTGATQQFHASVSGTTNTAVRWQVNSITGGSSMVGTISTTGVYTAPKAVPLTRIIVRAISAADSTKMAYASVTVKAATTLTSATSISVAVSPTSATLNTRATQQFTAKVSGTTNTGVRWAVNGVYGGNSTVGTITSGGLYTAPATAASNIIVKAISNANPLKSSAATVAVKAMTTTTVSSPKVTTSSLPGGTVNTAYSTTLAGSGGTTPYRWSLAGGSLPSGVSLASTGAISGTPATSGAFTISVRLTDAKGLTASANETLNVAAAAVPAPKVTTTSLPGATQNAAYSTTLAGSGGTAPYSWSLAGGSLPSGLSLSTSGTISGTPTASGSSAITVKLTDAKGQTASANESLNVAAASTSSSGGSSSGAKFFSSTSFINAKLNNPSVDPNSASMVGNSIAAQASAAHLSNYSYGVGLVYSSPSDKVYSVACTIYDSSSCLVGSSINFPIPQGVTPPSGTDHNTTFIYSANDGSPYAGMELDCWVAQYDAANDSWSCGTASLVKNTNAWGTCAEGNITSFHCNGGYAAGFDFAAGPIRPEEIKAGYIPHALVVAISNPGTGITCPATHTDAGGSGIPEGGHFFLPASYNVAQAASAGGWPAWVTTVAYALQNYGGYVVDYGGSFEVKGFTDQNPGSASWSSVGVPLDGWSDLAMLPWNQMQVQTMQSCN